MTSLGSYSTPFVMVDDPGDLPPKDKVREHRRLFTNLALRATPEPQGPWIWHAVQKPPFRLRPPEAEVTAIREHLEGSPATWINLSHGGARIPVSAVADKDKRATLVTGKEVGLAMALFGRSDGPVIVWLPSKVVWARSSPKAQLGVAWGNPPSAIQRVLSGFLSYLERNLVSQDVSGSR